MSLQVLLHYFFLLSSVKRIDKSDPPRSISFRALNNIFVYKSLSFLLHPPPSLPPLFFTSSLSLSNCFKAILMSLLHSLCSSSFRIYLVFWDTFACVYTCVCVCVTMQIKIIYVYLGECICRCLCACRYLFVYLCMHLFCTCVYKYTCV